MKKLLFVLSIGMLSSLYGAQGNVPTGTAAQIGYLAGTAAEVGYPAGTEAGIGYQAGYKPGTIAQGGTGFTLPANPFAGTTKQL